MVRPRIPTRAAWRDPHTGRVREGHLTREDVRRDFERHELELKLDRVCRAVLDDVGDEFRGQRMLTGARVAIGCELCSGEIVTDFST